MRIFQIIIRQGSLTIPSAKLTNPEPATVLENGITTSGQELGTATPKQASERESIDSQQISIAFLKNQQLQLISI